MWKQLKPGQNLKQNTGTTYQFAENLKNNMKIAFDYDDVLTDYVSGFLEFCNKIDGSNFVISDVRDFGFQSLFPNNPQASREKVIRFFGSGRLQSLRPNDGAVEVVGELSKKHELIVITSRPTYLTRETTSWIDKFFPGMFADVILTDHFNNDSNSRAQKNIVCLSEKVDLIIDDCLEWVEKCAHDGVRAFLFDRPWNQTDCNNKNITRIKELKDILRLI